jgi:hypothetical protein
MTFWRFSRYCAPTFGEMFASFTTRHSHTGGTMTRTHLVRTWLIAAAMAAAAPAGRLAASPIGGDGETGPIKDSACKLVGCSKGDLMCAQAHGEVSDPLIGKVSVTWFCYEPKPLET